ncbi:uncharacterized protein [Periplaneta americana]|uniref:uncharacterized protein n=1 Tax=Periplaneta americana TaxID=6978 RepID=UPI0037E83F12
MTSWIAVLLASSAIMASTVKCHTEDDDHEHLHLYPPGLLLEMMRNDFHHEEHSRTHHVPEERVSTTRQRRSSHLKRLHPLASSSNYFLPLLPVPNEFHEGSQREGASQSKKQKNGGHRDAKPVFHY